MEEMGGICGGRSRNDLIARDVIDHATCGVSVENAAGKGGIDKAWAIGVHHIATVGKICGGNAHLRKERGANVTLIHQVMNAARLPDGTAQPQQRGMEELRIIVGSCEESVVRNEDDEQIVPQRCRTQPID